MPLFPAFFICAIHYIKYLVYQFILYTEVKSGSKHSETRLECNKSSTDIMPFSFVDSVLYWFLCSLALILSGAFSWTTSPLSAGVRLSSWKMCNKEGLFVHQTNPFTQLNLKGLRVVQSYKGEKKQSAFISIGNKSMHETEQRSPGTRVASIFRTVSLKICFLLPWGFLSGQILK